MNNEMKPQSKLAREYQTTKKDNQVRFLRYREGAAVYGMSQAELFAHRLCSVLSKGQHYQGEKHQEISVGSVI